METSKIQFVSQTDHPLKRYDPSKIDIFFEKNVNISGMDGS